MIKTFTLNDVVRYIYDEVNEEEKREIETSLATDNELMEFYIETLETLDGMQKVCRMPSEKSIDNILSYSQSFVSNSI
jgi:hypothetical protein